MDAGVVREDKLRARLRCSVARFQESCPAAVSKRPKCPSRIRIPTKVAVRLFPMDQLSSWVSLVIPGA
jgi:hypothetical protein